MIWIKKLQPQLRGLFHIATRILHFHQFHWQKKYPALINLNNYCHNSIAQEPFIILQHNFFTCYLENVYGASHTDILVNATFTDGSNSWKFLTFAAGYLELSMVVFVRYIDSLVSYQSEKVPKIFSNVLCLRLVQTDCVKRSGIESFLTPCVFCMR